MAKAAAPSRVAQELKRYREAASHSVRSLARELGIPASSYQYYETDFKEPELPASFARKLAAILEERGVPRFSILALAGIESGRNIDQGESHGLALIEELDVRGSMGGGAAMDDAESANKIYDWQLPRDLVRTATYASPERIKIITVVGDSMEGTFHPFERVMVDTSDTSPSPPGVFVVYDGLGLVVKRVEYVPHSDPATVRITSDNPRYAAYERALGEAFIQGRVLGRWQWV